MRIREGDPLEIYTGANEEVVFKKYSPIGELGEFAVQYADVMSRACGLPVMIGDRDRVIAVAGESKKEYLERRLSAQLEQVMESRQTVTARQNGGKGAQVGAKSGRNGGKSAGNFASGKNTVRSAGKLQRVFGEESGRILRDAERMARGKSGGGANRGKTSKKRR
jgi:bifunctional DNA-binding transcriptional regulator/antitoxin component of YhaV-PrlF toxin-antitoxin module